MLITNIFFQLLIYFFIKNHYKNSKLKNIQKGISRQFIALELLRQNGFDKDLIDEAVF